MTTTVDYVESDELSKNNKFNLENRTKRLAQQFVDNKQEIELVESVVNQERSAAIKASQLQPAEAGGLISRLEVGITLKRYWQYYLTDVRQNGY